MRTQLNIRVPRKTEPYPPENRRRMIRVARRIKTARDELKRYVAEDRELGVGLQAIADAIAEGTDGDREAGPSTPEGVAKLARRAQNGQEPTP